MGGARAQIPKKTNVCLRALACDLRWLQRGRAGRAAHECQSVAKKERYVRRYYLTQT